MTKKEYIRRAMSLRPSAREWRELVERVVNYNGIVDYRNAEDSYADVHPLVGAIHERYARWHIYGSAYESICRKCRRMANKYHCVI